MPITRKEALLNSISGGESANLSPITREEQYLAYIAGESNSYPITPITRGEVYLDKIAKRGVSGGNGGDTPSGENKLVKIIDRTATEITAEDLQGATKIGRQAFAYLYSLTSIALPNTVTIIEQNAFTYCNSLVNLIISNSVKSIAQNAFTYCSYLKNLIIPNSVTSIGEMAFYNCTQLQTVTIGSGVKSLEAATFSGCGNVKYYDFTSHTSVPTLKDKNAIQGSTSFEIRVPMALATAWKAATNWSTYASKIVGVGFNLVEKDVSFTFRIGMTWGEFVNSDYNIGYDENGDEYTPFYIADDAVYYTYPSGSGYTQLNGEGCSVNDEIINGKEYYTDDY